MENLPITEDILLSRGFSRIKYLRDSDIFTLDIKDFEMFGEEYAQLIIKRGNGSDLDYWNVRYKRYESNFRGKPLL